jgi:iron(III) transport system ATP-binding protein
MLTVSGLTKSFAAKDGDSEVALAVDDSTFTVEAGSFFTLLGPSGCGKTTTLRCIAGLEDPDDGNIRLGDRTLFSSVEGVAVPSHKRGLGMVFQSYAIWPHMDVFTNVAFPLTVLPRRKRPGRSAMAQRVERVLETVELGHLARRPATDLSGGQQQRLALARALVMEPPLLLLDEPLSNLDAKLRENMRFELKRLQRELGVTSVYVTHDQDEALSMSTSIAVMSAGRIEQIAPPREVYDRPASRFVADFIGHINLIKGCVAEREAKCYIVDSAIGRLRIGSMDDHAVGAPVVVSVRPQHVEIAEYADHRPASADNTVVGEVLQRGFLGEVVEHRVLVDGVELQVRGRTDLSIAPHSKVTITLPERHCSLLTD